MHNRSIIIPTLLASISALSGCTEHLVYVQDTVLGIDATISTEGTQKVNLGFARETFALVPKKERDGEAMSAAAISRYEYEFLAAFNFNQFVATGAAAKQIALNPNSIARIAQLTGVNLQPIDASAVAPQRTK
jgi:hypothetical protein